jgi:hypothetical protein
LNICRINGKFVMVGIYSQFRVWNIFADDDRFLTYLA